MADLGSGGASGGSRAIAASALLLLLGALLLASPARAETGLAAPPPALTLEAAPAGALPPVVDGDVLGDPAWADAPVATGFRQTSPDEGQPATERTEVRVLFTADTLYVGVVCYDRNPEAIIVTDSRRDSSLSDSDSFQLIFDTFRDRQNGFVFGTSPAGQEYDGQVVNEGVGGSGMGRGGVSRGGGGGFNLNWDGVWQVRTTLSDIGWSAEFAVPFRTLRYPPGAAQTWGVNFQRTIRRRNETAYWAPLTLQYNLFRVSQAGELRGLQVPPGGARNLQLTPYVTGEVTHLDAHPGHGRTLGDVGADLKYSVTSGLTLDATWNTDFAQVEVDEQQINLDRFNLFFPEKRPFFLENAGAFTVANAGGAVQGDPAQTELFFSRRIGITDGGHVAPIRAGARLSGKVSNRVTVGFLNMQTEAVEGLTPANNFTVARLRRDLPNRSSIGGLLVNRQATGRQATGRQAGSGNHNRTYAFDGRMGIGRDADVQGFVARTATPGRSGRQHAYNVGANYESQTWRFQGGYMESGEDFNPEVGFTRRVGFRKVDGGVFYTWRPENFLKSFELRPHVTFNRFWDFSGFMETSLLHIDNRWEFEDSSTLISAWNIRGEGVKRAFRISGIPVPPGEYEWNEGNIWFNTNRSAPVSLGVRTVFGGFFGGTIVSLRPSLNVRQAETFNLSLIWTRNDIDLPAGSVVTNLVGARVGYNFSPRLFAQSLLQYNDSDELWSVNFRFGWLQDAGTGLFLVYNETEDFGLTRHAGAGRSLILKFSYLFDLLD